MEIIAYILMGVGLIISVIFGIILLIKAFQESVLWGLGYLFVPFVGLVFVIKFWDDCKKPFLYSLLGAGIYIVGILLFIPFMPEATTVAPPQ